MSGLFDGVRQEPVSIRGAPGKSPMFFRDFSLMGAVFLADHAAARAALPRGYRALKAPLGRALAAVHCMEYRDSDIGPYNEVSLSIALDRAPLPFMSLLQAARAMLTRTYHAYVAALPVTTETALHGGVDFFNYPKVLADVSFRETAAARVATLRERGGGALVCEFEGRRLPTRSRPSSGRDAMTLLTYPEMGGRPMRARLEVDRLERATAWGRGASVRLGPRAGVFGDLKLGPVVEYLYAPRCQGILYKPEAL